MNVMFVESGLMDSVLLRIRCVPANGGFAGVRPAFEFAFSDEQSLDGGAAESYR